MDDLIRRSEAIEALGEEPYVWTDDDEFAMGERSQWLDDISAIRAVSAGWILTKDSLPEKPGRYLTVYPLMDDMLWTNILYYGQPIDSEKDCFYASDSEWGDAEYDDVIAWMPLPEFEMKG